MILLPLYLIVIATLVATARLRPVRHGLGFFGKKKRRAEATEARDILLGQLVSQQAWSFALLWVSVAVGMILGYIVIGRVIIDDALDLTLLREAIPLAADLWIGKKAWVVYKEVSQRASEMILRDLGRGGSGGDDTRLDRGDADQGDSATEAPR